MGARLARNLKSSVYTVRHVEVSEDGRKRLKDELGITCVDVNTALDGADAAAPFAGHLPERKDLVYFVTHPCHPSIFNNAPTEAARLDRFGGLAAPQSIVNSLMQEPQETYAVGEAIAKTIYAPVLERLLKRIRSGEIPAGEQLPSERELMDEYGVGRPAVREALQWLSRSGIVTIHHGERARVAVPTAESLVAQITSGAQHLLRADPAAIEHLKEVRVFLESGMARLAAKHADEASVRGLRQNLQTQQGHERDPQQFVSTDMDFHTRVAAMSGNPIFPVILAATLNWLALNGAEADALTDSAMQARAQDPHAVLFDVPDLATQAIVGRQLWRHTDAGRSLFTVGSSGVEYALVPEWAAQGLINGEHQDVKSVGAVKQLAVVSGSCSEITALQIRTAGEQGFVLIAVDAARLASRSQGDAEQSRLLELARAALDQGRSVIVHSALGPDSMAAPSADAEPLALGRRLGRLLRDMVAHGSLQRAVVAGGDTSSHALRELHVHALTVAMALPQTPGSPLCTAHSDDAAFDGLQVALKGGRSERRTISWRYETGGAERRSSAWVRCRSVPWPTLAQVRRIHLPETRHQRDAKQASVQTGDTIAGRPCQGSS